LRALQNILRLGEQAKVPDVVEVGVRQNYLGNVTRCKPYLSELVRKRTGGNASNPVRDDRSSEFVKQALGNTGVPQEPLIRSPNEKSVTGKSHGFAFKMT